MNNMNWFQAEQHIHEHKRRAEKAAQNYPHIAHLLEQESIRGRIHKAWAWTWAAVGRLIIRWCDYIQERRPVKTRVCELIPAID